MLSMLTEAEEAAGLEKAVMSGLYSDWLRNAPLYRKIYFDRKEEYASALQALEVPSPEV